MNWTAPRDLYCERLEPGLWAEPLNALSNLGFIAAGLWLWWRSTRRTNGSAPDFALRILAILIVLIGLGSSSFHTFAVVWAEVLDILFIALFICAFVIVYAHHVLRAPWRWAWLAAGAFWVFGKLVTAPFDPASFNGSVSYFPALAGIALMGVVVALRKMPGAGMFGLAALVFLISISLRSVDPAWCRTWPYGTHWAWHLLNALTLTLSAIALERSVPKPFLKDVEPRKFVLDTQPDDTRPLSIPLTKLI